MSWIECEGFGKLPEDQEIEKYRSKIRTKKKETGNCSLYKAIEKSMLEEVTSGETRVLVVVAGAGGQGGS